jgi:hypothetical protein
MITEKEARQVAATIAEQLGGRKMQVMVGCKEFHWFKQARGGLEMRFSARNPRGINHVIVTLEASDTYKVEFWSVRVPNAKKIEEFSDVYASDLRRLFESTTGLATHL